MNKNTTKNYILILAGEVPSENHLGGIFEFDQAKALKDAGLNILFAAIDIRSIRRWRKWGFVIGETHGIPVISYNFPVGRMPHCISRFFYRIFARKIMKRIIKLYGKPKLIHAHFTEMGYCANEIYKKYKIPYIMTEHSSKVNKKVIHKGLYKTAKVAYDGAKKVIAVSGKLAGNIKENFGIESEVIFNIVDLKIFKPDRAGRNGGDSFTVVSVGNLNYRKGFDILIKAFSAAFSGQENIFLKIIGRGEEQEALQKLILDLKEEDRIELCGFKKREEIARIFKESDCFALASRGETFGVVYIEAMAAGLPVIATRCGGPECFVKAEHGLLVKNEDETALVAAFQKMKENISFYNAQEIAAYTAENFSSGKIAEQIKAVYEQIDSEGCND